MRLDRFFIVNKNTASNFVPSVGLFEGSDIFEYEGAIIVYGTLGVVNMYLPATRGRFSDRARPSCPVFIKAQPPAEVIERALEQHALNGLPLWAVEDEGHVNAWIKGATIRGEAILNMQWPSGSPRTKDAMIERARLMIDAFRNFEQGKGVPEKIKQMRIRAQLLDPYIDPPAFLGREHYEGLGGVI